MAPPPPNPITPTSLPDLKNTTDDALATYLDTLSPALIPSNILTDTRLLLSLVASLLAASVGICDWLYDFSATKTYTLAAVLVYFALNGAITYWVLKVERGRIWIGTVASTSPPPTSNPSKPQPPLQIPPKYRGATLSLASRTVRYTPTYYLRAKYRLPGSDAADEHVLELKAEFADWFTEKGVFCQEPFRKWLAAEVPVLGALDPGKVQVPGVEIADEKPVVEKGESNSERGGDERIGAAVEEQASIGTGAAPEGSIGRRGGKRRKI